MLKFLYQWFEKLLADDDGSFDRLGYAYYYLAEIWVIRGQRETAAKNLRLSLNRLPLYERALQFAEKHDLNISARP
jgi:hypothetical protein